MTNPILNFSSNQSLSNPLVSESDAQALIDASIATGGIPTFDNTVSYVTDDIVYYLGLFYIAPANISSGGGTPLANTAWKQIENWGSYTATASSAGTLTLTKYSNVIQRITGSTTHTIVLPVTSTLPALGKQYIVINSSSGAVAIQSSGANAIVSLTTNQYCILTCILLSGTTAASWHYTVSGLTVGDALTSGTLAQFAATTSAQLRGVISDETGSGVLVFADTPTLITPILGVATATTINKVTITAPATSATLTIDDGKTLRSKKTLTLEGTDSTEHTFPNSNSVLARTDTGQSFTGSHEFLNGLLVGEEGGLTLKDTLSADGKRSSCMSKIFVLGETCVFGDLVYYKSADSRWWKTDRDTESTSGNVMIGFVCVAGNAGDTTNILLQGIIRADSKFPTLTVGAPVYIGSTAGEVQVSKPTSGIVRLIGYAETADSIVFKPSDDYYELGTFSPGITFGGASVGITYSNQVGLYRKYLGYYEFNIYINLSSKGSSTGVLLMVNMPYNSSSVSNSFQGPSINLARNITFGDWIGSYVNVNTTQLVVQKMTSGGAEASITDADMTNTSALILTGIIKT